MNTQIYSALQNAQRAVLPSDFKGRVMRDGLPRNLRLQEGDGLVATVIGREGEELTLRTEDGVYFTARQSGPPPAVGQTLELTVTQSTPKSVMVEVTDRNAVNLRAMLASFGAEPTEENIHLANEILRQGADPSPATFNRLKSLLSAYKSLSTEQAVFMTKHDIPVNNQTIRQFQGFLHHQNQLGQHLGKLLDILESLEPTPASPRNAATVQPQVSAQPQATEAPTSPQVPAQPAAEFVLTVQPQAAEAQTVPPSQAPVQQTEAPQTAPALPVQPQTADAQAAPTAPAQPQTAEAQAVPAVLLAQPQAAEVQTAPTVSTQPQAAEAQTAPTTSVQPQAADTQTAPAVPSQPQAAEAQAVPTVPAPPQTAEAQTVPTTSAQPQTADAQTAPATLTGPQPAAAQTAPTTVAQPQAAQAQTASTVPTGPQATAPQTTHATAAQPQTAEAQTAPARPQASMKSDAPFYQNPSAPPAQGAFHPKLEQTWIRPEPLEQPQSLQPGLKEARFEGPSRMAPVPADSAPPVVSPKGEPPTLRSLAAALFKDVSTLATQPQTSKELRASRLMRELSELLDAVERRAAELPRTERNEVVKAAREIEQQVKFMEHINNFTSYIQIPLQIGNRRETAELYVFNDAKGRRKIDPENATLFLSLNTANLGLVESFVKLIGKNVECDFTLEAPETAQAFSSAMSQLSEGLKALGYTLGRASSKVAEAPRDALDVAQEHNVILGRYTVNRVI